MVGSFWFVHHEETYLVLGRFWMFVMVRTYLFAGDELPHPMKKRGGITPASVRCSILVIPNQLSQARLSLFLTKFLGTALPVAILLFSRTLRVS